MKLLFFIFHLLKKCLEVVRRKYRGTWSLWLNVFTVDHMSWIIQSQRTPHVNSASLSPKRLFHLCPLPQISKAILPSLLPTHDLACSSLRALNQSEENLNRLLKAHPFYYHNIRPYTLTLIYYYGTWDVLTHACAINLSPSKNLFQIQKKSKWAKTHRIKRSLINLTYSYQNT